MKRLYFFDNLKLFLTANVIFFHASLPFIPLKQWIFLPSDPTELVPKMWMYAMLFLSFCMSLFFFISAYFVTNTYSNSTFQKFLQKKFVRLGIPLTLAILTFELFLGVFDVGPLWFAENLLVFFLIYALYKRYSLCFLKIHIERFSLVNLLLFGLIMASLTYLVGYRFKYGQIYWVFRCVRIEPAHFFHYVVMFILGIVAYRNNLIHKMSNRFGCLVMIIGLLLFLLISNYGSELGSWESVVYSRWFCIYESIMCVFLCVGVLWFFREHCGSTNRLLMWCYPQCYGCYIFHIPILLGIELLFDNVPFPTVILKFLFEATFCIIITVLFVSLLRKISIVSKVI